MAFRSKKRIDGFSTCFRQWKAEGTHCKYVHGYGVYFDVTFEGELDDRNWVMDFGFMKRSNTLISWHNGVEDGLYSVKDWFDMMFDHTTVIAQDDPAFFKFLDLHNDGILKLRTLPVVGCEIFAKAVYDVLNNFLFTETKGRVKVVEVECFEHAKNSAIYFE